MHLAHIFELIELLFVETYLSYQCLSCTDVWYVNCDGKEGWVPADILKEYVDDEIPVSGESTPNSSRLSSNPVSSDECEDVDGEWV